MVCAVRGHFLPASQRPHRGDRAPVVEYRGRECGAVFTLFPGTFWAGTHDSCTKIVLILGGVAQGIPPLQRADELECDDGALLQYRHPMQEAALLGLDRSPLEEAVTEGEARFQNAGEQGEPHRDPADPPRRRANPRRGRGTMANDRPPVQGVVGRDRGEIRLTVCDDTRQDTLQPEVEAKTVEGAMFYSDESPAYNRVEASGRPHGTGCHSRSEYVRDNDGDGVREIHCNTMEGIWTGWRNFLRPFRGVHKASLAQYVAMFEGAHHLKRITDRFLRVLMIPRFIYLPT